MLVTRGPVYTNAFQSTHPVRGATPSVLDLLMMFHDFNPRTP